MTLADASAIENVVAYINTLPGADVTETIAGDPSKSAALYQSTCAQCHGDDGRGVWTVNAPALTGLDDWYMAEQLQKFRAGIRGRHDDDLYGLQMGLLSNTLVDDEAVNDMVAYINTL
jgi:cytochrome c oxidase subunit 2